MDPLFLTVDEVLEIHLDQLKRYGGTAGIRDRGLLESAVAAPMSSFGGQYLHPDVYEQAGAYLFHLVQNHPFLDGNKRMGVASALTFLMMNGVELDVSNEALVRMVLSVAQGQMDKATVSQFFRRHTGR